MQVSRLYVGLSGRNGGSNEFSTGDTSRNTDKPDRHFVGQERFKRKVLVHSEGVSLTIPVAGNLRRSCCRI